MTRKITILLLFLFLVVSPVLAVEKARTGMLPDNPLYFVKSITSNIKTSLTFGEINKAERLIEVANNKLNEAITLAEKQKPKIVAQAIKNYKKLLNRSLELITQAKGPEIKTDEALIELAKNILNQQESILTNIQSVPEIMRPIFRQAVETEKEIYNKITNSISKDPSKENQESLANLETQKQRLDLRLADTGILTTVQLADLQQQSGKPGMNEEGSTQVVRPEGVGGCNSKKCLCQVNCGRTIIEKCVLQSGNYMYQMLNCRGECTKYNLFYGCGMEAGCDESCWDDYYEHCGSDAHENCLTGCEETFDD